MMKNHRRKNSRKFVYVGKKQSFHRIKNIYQIAIFLALILVVYFGTMLTIYVVNHVNSRHTSAIIREEFHEVNVDQATHNTIYQTAVALTDNVLSPLSTINIPVAVVSPSLRANLDVYPNNPRLIISDRFSKLRKRNKDIVGWLIIEDMLEEAVVQRNSTYYLKRDYLGYHNSNGAIFLDEVCSLSRRPLSLILYGHNMKSGNMFGCLRKYENISIYRKNPFISFDTIYEEGRFVIVSISQISVVQGVGRYIDLNQLYSTDVDIRTNTINALNSYSIYKSKVNIQPEDQLLLLVTCVGDDNERRVVTARRIRPDETEHQLLEVVSDTKKR